MLDLAALGLRDYLLMAVALAGAYVLYSLLRTGAKPGGAPQPAGSGSGNSFEPAAATGRADLRPEPSNLVAAKAGGDAAADPGFSSELARSSVDLELRRLRRELDEMRDGLSRMAGEIRQLKAARNVSPAYSEAMTLAQQGETAAEIAAQCGISLGEAELVAALARSSDEGPKGSKAGR